MALPTPPLVGAAGHLADHGTIGTQLNQVVSPFVLFGVTQGLHSARPAAGTAGRFYYETDTGLAFYDTGSAWASLTQPSLGCRAYRAGALNLSSSVTTTILLDAENFDTSSIHSTSVTPSRLIVPVGLAGKWLVTCQGGYGANGAGYRQTALLQNGSGIGDVLAGESQGTQGTRQQVHAVVAASEADFFEMQMRQTSGSTLAVSDTWLSAM